MHFGTTCLTRVSSGGNMPPAGGRSARAASELNAWVVAGAQDNEESRMDRRITFVSILPPVLLALLALSAAACTHVAPYERGKLAHPMMTADDLEGPAASHVLAVHEGATGGGSLSESGCGCN